MHTSSLRARGRITDEDRYPELDPRMKLLLVLLICTCAYMAATRQTLIILYATIVALYLLRRLWRGAEKTALFFGAILVAEFLSEGLPAGGLQAGGRMSLFFVERISVFFIMGNWMALRLRIGDLIAALQSMHVPKGITVTLAVVFRYLPTVREEVAQINKAMRQRGVAPGLRNILCHPLRTLEYVIVPLVIRSLKVADELAASAMTRGLDLKGERTSYRQVRLRPFDFLVTGVTLALVIGSLVLEAKGWKARV